MASEHPTELRVPLAGEQLTIGKRPVATDRVRVRTVVETEQVLIEEVLRSGTFAVERISVDREVAEAPAPRQEDDTLVVSIVEERLVVEKRLFVVEEVRVTSTFSDERIETPVALRRMRAVVEREGSNPTVTGETHD